MTKADLEKQLVEKEEELNKYRQWLMESDEKYNKLVEEKEKQFKLLPEYSEMKNHIKRLELIQKNNEDTIAYKRKKEKRLKDKIQELLVENRQLLAENAQSKDTSKNQISTKKLQDQTEIQIPDDNKQLEVMQKANEEIKKKLQELLTENEKLKQDINNLTRHNARGAGRKPKSQEKIQDQLQQLSKLLDDDKTEQDICKNMGISRATYYRLKRLL